jgi:5'-nucleotidase
MRRTRLAVAVTGLLVALGVSAQTDEDARSSSGNGGQNREITVKIIGFNDYHGNLQSPGTFGLNTTIPAAQRPPVGGAEYMAAHVAKLKAENPNNVVVGAGDFIGASPLISALFHDEPSVETLNRIGLEFNAVGNHEFDKGFAELLRLQRGGCKMTNGAVDPNSCRGAEVGTPVPFEGAKFRWLSANVIRTSTGQPLLPPYGIKEFSADGKHNRGDGHGVSPAKVAFIGMTLRDTPRIVTPTGVAGLEFRDEATTVNALIPQLRKLGVDAVVVLVHQGGFQNPINLPPNAFNASDINGCLGDLRNVDGTDSEIRHIVAELDDEVDLVISGHTHAAYNCSADTVDVIGISGTPVVAQATPRPAGLPNNAGRLIPVTSASSFGRVLTDIDLTIGKVREGERDVTAVRVNNVLVDRTDADATARIEANPKVRDIVNSYNTAVSPLANAVIGTIVDQVNNTSDSGGMRPAGALIADAQLAATQPAALGGAVMAFMNPGGVRDQGFIDYVAPVAYPYDVTYGDAFRVQPFGNSLVTMTLTAQQIKDLLEQQFIGCRGQIAQRTLQVSNGLQYSWRFTQPAPSVANPSCDFIWNAAFTPTDLSNPAAPVVTGTAVPLVVNGVVQDPARTFRVTVNNFLATGGDNFTVLTAGASPLGGAQDIDALVAYFAAFRAPGAAYDRTNAAVVGPLPRVIQLPRL